MRTSAAASASRWASTSGRVVSRADIAPPRPPPQLGLPHACRSCVSPVRGLTPRASQSGGCWAPTASGAAGMRRAGGAAGRRADAAGPVDQQSFGVVAGGEDDRMQGAGFPGGEHGVTQECLGDEFDAAVGIVTETKRAVVPARAVE